MESKRKYIILFTVIFTLSVAVLFSQWRRPGFPRASPCPPGVNCELPPKERDEPRNLLIWLPAFTAAFSAIGTVSTVILAWKGDRRNDKEMRLNIARLELELEEARKKSGQKPPKNEKRRR